MKHFETNFSSKSSENFHCKKCHYFTCRKSQYTRHLLTAKHINETNETNLKQKSSKSSTIFKCICSELFNSRTSLWRHKKQCKTIISTEEINHSISINDTDKEQLIRMLIKQNSEIIKETFEFKNFIMDHQNVMLDVIKNGTHNITTNNNNSHNKSFNLQFFLNETCKDAMNINDFIDSIKLQLCDLEKVGELGYVEGISNIILKNLNALDVTLRPIHCTDKKRETMYIKDEDKWEKEDEKKVKLHKMVRKVANKNIDLISDFKQLYPDWKKSTSKVSDQFNKIIIESMGGPGDNEYENEEKVIKKVAKEVFIDKSL
jgi:hypothetical protein